MRPLLNLIGRRIFPAGPRPECATAIKLANNAVLGCAMVAMAEGFALVRKYGVQPQVFQDVMVEGLFAATAYKVYGQKMVDESYDQVGSPITVGLKDALLIAAAADWPACRCRAMTSTTSACSALSPTATPTAIRPSSRANRRGRAA